MLCTSEQASEWDDDAEWTIDHAQGDADGWEYAFNFGFEWHDKCGMTDCVRRRAWIRRLRKCELQQASSVCGVDLSPS